MLNNPTVQSDRKLAFVVSTETLFSVLEEQAGLVELYLASVS